MASKEFTIEERIRQDVLLLTVNDDFLIDVRRLEKKYGLPIHDEEDDDRFMCNHHHDFETDVYTVRHKYNLPESHGAILSFFIRHGHLNYKVDNTSSFWHLNPWTTTSETVNCIMLKIYPDTTLKDIQKNWPRIKIARDQLLNRKIEKKVRIKNLVRDLEILKLKREGNTAKKIMTLINRDERFKNEKVLAYEEIPKIIQRLKNMAEKNMAHKES